MPRPFPVRRGNQLGLRRVDGVCRESSRMQLPDVRSKRRCARHGRLVKARRRPGRRSVRLLLHWLMLRSAPWPGRHRHHLRRREPGNSQPQQDAAQWPARPVDSESCVRGLHKTSHPDCNTDAHHRLTAIAIPLSSAVPPTAQRDVRCPRFKRHLCQHCHDQPNRQVAQRLPAQSMPNGQENRQHSHHRIGGKGTSAKPSHSVGLTIELAAGTGKRLNPDLILVSWEAARASGAGRRSDRRLVAVASATCCLVGRSGIIGTVSGQRSAFGQEVRWTTGSILADR